MRRDNRIDPHAKTAVISMDTRIDSKTNDTEVTCNSMRNYARKLNEYLNDRGIPYRFGPAYLSLRNRLMIKLTDSLNIIMK